MGNYTRGPDRFYGAFICEPPRKMCIRDSFWAAEQTPYPARRMLTACAGRMLGVLETDEAARRVASALLQAQGLIDAIRADEPEGAPAVEASELACALASAQFLRENMGDCDAALRTLPTEIEALYLSLHVREDRCV